MNSICSLKPEWAGTKASVASTFHGLIIPKESQAMGGFLLLNPNLETETLFPVARFPQYQLLSILKLVEISTFAFSPPVRGSYPSFPDAVCFSGHLPPVLICHSLRPHLQVCLLDQRMASLTREHLPAEYFRRVGFSPAPRHRSNPDAFHVSPELPQLHFNESSGLLLTPFKHSPLHT